MCGIAGIVAGRGIAGDQTRIRAMTGALQHRGPDGDGYWEEGDVYFGHRRLSVIDLSPAGNQPMVSHDGRFVLTYNGEVYNHQVLRSELEQGVAIAWRGSSDTETLVEALARWGIEKTLARVNGMFAFGLWDRRTSTLTLARDPFGEKPLYYSVEDDSLAFASEFVAFEQLPTIDAAPDPSSVATYLSRWYVPAPLSIAKAVAKLPEGCFLVWRRGDRPEVKSYWSVGDAVSRGRLAPVTDPGEAIAELETLLTDAVKIRLMSDVPLGTLLSGGVDSSLVAALMQKSSAAPVRTFSIGFQEEAYNEARDAKGVADFLGTEHTELYVTEADALALVPRLGSIYDEPFADSSQIPTFLVCAMARRHVTVALTGDGGDELFAGYTRYTLVSDLWKRVSRIPGRKRLAALVENLPTGLLRFLAPVIAPLVPKRLGTDNLAGKLKRSGPMLKAAGFPEFYSAFIGGWPRPEALVADPGAVIMPAYSPTEPEGMTDMDLMMWWDSINLLPNDLLVKVDRASMAVGLEGRMPLLDRRIAEFAWRLPRKLRLLDGVGKWPLRAILHKHVPRELVERPKMGFGIPLDLWLRGGLKAWASDLLSPARLRRQGLLNPAAVDEAWTSFLASGPHSSTQIWTLLMLQSWMDSRGR